jgi:Barnase-EndoU-ColicinE5/D-RelE like nuclease
MSNKRYPQILLGPLPVELINSTLDVELEPGAAIITSRAHRHIASDHPEDYAAVMTYIHLLIAQPTYIGQSPHHASAFEMVRRVIIPNQNEIILAAVNFTRNERGNYYVHSAYRLKESEVTRRIQYRHLCNPKKKGPG